MLVAKTKSEICFGLFYGRYLADVFYKTGTASAYLNQKLLTEKFAVKV